MEGATKSGMKILEEAIDRIAAMRSLSIGAQLSDTALELALLGIGSCVVGAPSLAVLHDPAFLDQA